MKASWVHKICNKMIYANLEAYNLPDPQAIFELTYFTRRPEPFFTLAKELFPGNFKPTLCHFFFVLLYRKGLLRRVFTQNIDTLERMAGLPSEQIVEAHGSFATATCLICKSTTSAIDLKPRIDLGEVVRCDKPSCKGRANALVKPDIVFFGEGLPKAFFDRLTDLSVCDLLLVMGTSLQVQPFASIIDRVKPDCPRVLINLEAVGEMDDLESFGRMFGRFRETGFDFEGRLRGGEKKARDVCYLGEADDGVMELASLLGWKDELEELKVAYDKKPPSKATNTPKVDNLTTAESSTTKSSDVKPTAIVQDRLVVAKSNADAIASKLATSVNNLPKDELVERVRDLSVSNDAVPEKDVDKAIAFVESETEQSSKRSAL